MKEREKFVKISDNVSHAYLGSKIFSVPELRTNTDSVVKEVFGEWILGK
jgi:hypothetical protein